MNIAAWLDAHSRPWTVRFPRPAKVTIRRGRVPQPYLEYAARDLSAVEVAGFLEQYQAIPSADEARRIRQLRAFLRRLFPGLFWWTRPDPVELILALPKPGQDAVLNDFFAYRAGQSRPAISTAPTPASPSRPFPPPMATVPTAVRSGSDG